MIPRRTIAHAAQRARAHGSEKEGNKNTQKKHTHLEAAVSIKLLSKFHLNPLIVNSITQTACMRACISACVFCEWVCTCKPP